MRCPILAKRVARRPGSSSTVRAYATFNDLGRHCGMKIHDLFGSQPKSQTNAPVMAEREGDMSQIHWQNHLPVREGGLWEPGNFRMWAVPDGH